MRKGCKGLYILEQPFLKVVLEQPFLKVVKVVLNPNTH